MNVEIIVDFSYNSFFTFHFIQNTTFINFVPRASYHPGNVKLIFFHGDLCFEIYKDIGCSNELMPAHAQ